MKGLDDDPIISGGRILLDWFGNKRTLVCFQIIRKMVNKIWFQFDLIRFLQDFSATRKHFGDAQSWNVAACFAGLNLPGKYHKEKTPATISRSEFSLQINTRTFVFEKKYVLISIFIINYWSRNVIEIFLLCDKKKVETNVK